MTTQSINYSNCISPNGYETEELFDNSEEFSNNNNDATITPRNPNQMMESVNGLASSRFPFLFKDEEELKNEFANLPNAQFDDTSEIREGMGFDVSLRKENAPKNRYGNIFPNDNTRVKLEGETDDYINANYCLQGRVILSQGPMDDGDNNYWFHHEDFFHMMWINHSTAILMVTDWTEKGVVKCSNYLPKNTKSVKVAGHYILTIDSNPQDDTQTNSLNQMGIKITHLVLSKKGHQSNLKVKHYHYATWQDRTAGNVKPLSVLSKILSDENKPVIHCSAGIGRSGTVAAIFDSYSKIKSEPYCDQLVPKTLTDLRNERRGCVQNSAQYLTIYNTLQLLVEEDMRKSAQIDANLIANTSAPKTDSIITVKCKISGSSKLYIRGQGPGLNWDKGQPLEKIGEDTYVYRTNNMNVDSGPIEFKVLIDDQRWEEGYNHQVQGGQTLEISPVF